MGQRVMGAQHVAEAGGKFEPQRPFNFKLILPQDALDSKEDVELSVLSFTVPNQSNEPITIPFLNEDRKVPGPITFEDATLVCVDYVDPNVLKSFLKWRDMVWDPKTGGIGLARDIKKDATLRTLGPANASDYVRNWKLHGLWPRSLQHGEFNMAQRTEYKQLTVVFAVDWMEYEQES